MLTRLIFAALFLSFQAHASDGISPTVPGAMNPAVTAATLGQTICKSGWTATVRPPVSYTNGIKNRLLQGQADKNPAHYELDHLVSIELGGSPASPDNLWLEPYAGPCGARTKDRIETTLKRLVCTGKLSLTDAQSAITSDWTAAFRRYIGPLSCH